MFEDLKQDFMEFHTMLRNDNIHFGKKRYIRALSPLWWVVRGGQFALAFGSFYALYCGLWLLVG